MVVICEIAFRQRRFQFVSSTARRLNHKRRDCDGLIRCCGNNGGNPIVLFVLTAQWTHISPEHSVYTLIRLGVDLKCKFMYLLPHQDRIIGNRCVSIATAVVCKLLRALARFPLRLLKCEHVRRVVFCSSSFRCVTRKQKLTPFGQDLHLAFLLGCFIVFMSLTEY